MPPTSYIRGLAPPPRRRGGCRASCNETRSLCFQPLSKLRLHDPLYKYAAV